MANPTGLSYEQRVDQLYGGLCNFYIIECWGEDEHFYTFGKTTNKINRRYSGLSTIYAWEPYIIIEGLVKSITACENFFNDEKGPLHKYRYTPKYTFGGIVKESIKIPKNELQKLFA